MFNKPYPADDDYVTYTLDSSVFGLVVDLVVSKLVLLEKGNP
jgi:hypothetical protein